MGAKTPTEQAQEFAQAVLSVAPVIILGSGASAAHQVPGMGALAAHLTALSDGMRPSRSNGPNWSLSCAAART